MKLLFFFLRLGKGAEGKVKLMKSQAYIKGKKIDDESNFSSNFCWNQSSYLELR